MAITGKTFAHSVGVAVVVPHILLFKPTPNMTPLQIAYHKGREARRLGKPESDNPHTEYHVPNEGQQSAEWLRGYNGK